MIRPVLVRFDRTSLIGRATSRGQGRLADPEIRRLIEAQPHLQLELKDDEGKLFGSLPEGVDEIVFHVHGILKDVERLKLLFDLFAAVLDRLAELGIATEEAPPVEP
jgi:hypothetical protein